MRKRFKFISMLTLALALTFGIGLGAVHAASWTTFSKELPMMKGNTVLSTKKKNNNSQAKIQISYIGSTYWANLWITRDSNGKTVSGTLKNINQSSKTYSLTVDQSAVGHNVNLNAEAASWSIRNVEISGKWQEDSN
ncbi:hypothetical protein ABWW58_07930 [Sporolactobacillus sp. STCC-11]|uniref:hypothetical protein n=1 Tax=Sporolactobacillus caesalpiniae TaxID=3230362 RepID=UPI00339B4D97